MSGFLDLVRLGLSSPILALSMPTIPHWASPNHELGPQCCGVSLWLLISVLQPRHLNPASGHSGAGPSGVFQLPASPGHFQHSKADQKQNWWLWLNSHLTLNNQRALGHLPLPQMGECWLSSDTSPTTSSDWDSAEQRQKRCHRR